MAPGSHKVHWFISMVGIIGAILLLSACGGTSPTTSANGSGSTIVVVAAENFYGDMVRQIGGSHVTVTSILSDPNVDPHEYQSNYQTAQSVSKAQLVIENGGGYDDWMDKILSSLPSQNRILVKAFDVARVHLTDNEHVWYSIDNAQTIAQAITDNLKTLQPANAAEFDSNFSKFSQGLQQVQQKISDIKTKYANAPVALTETIFLYQTTAMKLNVLTPLELEKAVAEGNDPPANAIITAENQLQQKQVKVLIYNEQTATPVTDRLLKDAQQANIPTVKVTETMPQGKTYQSWMLDQLTALEKALGQ